MSASTVALATTHADRSGPLVVLAPMAGITNAAYRQLCREQAELGGPARSLFVCEMITSRGLVERDPKTLSML